MVATNTCAERVDLALDSSPYYFIVTAEDGAEVSLSPSEPDVQLSLQAGEKRSFTTDWYGQGDEGKLLSSGTYELYGVLQINAGGEPELLKTQSRRLEFISGDLGSETVYDHPCISLRVDAPSSLRVSELSAVSVVAKNTCNESVELLIGGNPPHRVYLNLGGNVIFLFNPGTTDAIFSETFSPGEELAFGIADSVRRQIRDSVSESAGTTYELYGDLGIFTGTGSAGETYRLRTPRQELTILP